MSMRTLVVIVISFLVALQPMLSLESPSFGEEKNISFSSYVNYEDNSNWWEDTSMDNDKDGIQDSIWLAIDSKKHNWVDDNGRIGVIVDFDHLPTSEDEILLKSIKAFLIISFSTLV